MIITIHRGINQIGGCITEIASASGTKILIDLGHNLPDGDNPSEDKYDNSANLSALLDGVKAVFYTHPHGDHVGFETEVAKKGINQYIGRISKELMLLLKGHLAYRGNPKYKAELDAFKKFHTFEEKENETKPAIYCEGLCTVGEKSVIPDNVQIGKNTMISGITVLEDYPNGVLDSGRTLEKAGDEA